MRWYGFVLSVILCACLSPSPAGADLRPAPVNLLPIPSSVQFGSGRLAVDTSFQIGATGTVDDRLRHGVARALVRLSRQTGLELSRELAADASKARLTIVCAGPGAAVPSLDENESYSLEVTGDRATLRAPTVVGALRGLETVLQLATGDRGGWYLPAVTIQDAPRFRWRGLLIDIARHWMPMDVLKRNLDLMAAVKLNVLHLHLTEDQGFRIESKRYPSLHEKGSIYRISEITITASIPPQIGFAIARSGDEAELAAPVGGVASSELADRLASEDEVVDLEGDVLEMLPEQPSTG